MSPTVILSDQGQDYIEFDILDNLIVTVRPSRLPGWKDTKVRNAAFLIGGRLVIELHNGYAFALPYPITHILPFGPYRKRFLPGTEEG